MTHSHPSIPPLEPDFLAGCNSLLKPTQSTYTDRLSRLVTALKQTDNRSPAVWIAEPGPSSSYFTGAFASSDWHLSERPFLIAITPAEDGVSPNITLLTPEFERIRAQLKPLPEQVEGHLGWVSWQESESPYDVLAQHLGKKGGVLVDPMVRNFISAGLARTMEGCGDTIDAEKAVASIRERKDEREIGLLRCANQVSTPSYQRLNS